MHLPPGDEAILFLDCFATSWLAMTGLVDLLITLDCYHMNRIGAGIIMFLMIAQPACMAASIAKSAPQRSPALRLSDCYALALKQSETIAIKAELIKEAEGRFLQALGAALPHISFSSTDTQNDAEGLTSSSSSLALSKKDSEKKFVFKQTLFSGFKEFAGISGSGSERKQRVKEKLRAEQLLLADVADAFYLLIEQQEDLKALKKIETALKGRVRDLKDRAQLGRSRRSEVVNTQAQVYGVEAEIELVKSREALARQLLEFLTGEPVYKVADEGSAFPSLEDEQYYISKANLRPDVLAAWEAWRVAEKRLAAASSDFLPTVTAEGNYYAQRTTSLKNAKWDAQLKVDLPIFKGTETFGAVGEANAKAHQTRLEFLRAKRSAAQDIRDSIVNFRASCARTNTLKKALYAAGMNYHLQKEDYRLSLVNNLDVLQAIQALQDAKRNFIHALYETKRLFWQLRAAVGDSVFGGLL